ncbi:metallophosphoesterase family protein [Sporosarcina aquimarina]|uniref:DNA repair exonuclease n=1 Tax=Sporosarcina aquimarina TaxID=114975 RepID=A0ABU4G268_9BACL|nr:DNA repair exonuclease [Sporosarcina aquimarina]MDW0111048.1 DNA repair exonuclease [Sporosarcina aquimarina]
MIRFIHTADLHLDSPFKGMTEMPADRLAELRESTFAAYENVIQYAETSLPDFILIAGDIYDGEDRSLRAQMRFVKGLERLKQAGIPVFISHGNHDHLAGKWTRFELPDNVTVFGPFVETVELKIREHLVRIHGFSYPERHVRKPMIEHYPIIQREQGTLDIGMLHGSLMGEETHAVYAPFTKEALVGKGYHYWALGHIHKRQTILSEPPVVYPGNIQGRHRNEQGVKGIYEVELEETHAAFKFVPTSVLVFDEIEVDCSKLTHANEWLAVCLELVSDRIEQIGACILSVHNVNISEEAVQMFASSTSREWLEILRESAEKDVWFAELTFENTSESVQLPDSPLVRSVKEQMVHWELNEWKHVLKDVYQHARSAPYLSPINQGMKEDLIEEAGKLISNELSK